MEVPFVDIGYFLSGLYSLILILIGTPLNLLCFYIFTRLVPNRSNPTIIVFAYLALIELIIPFTWNMNYVVRELFWKYQTNSSLRNLEQYSLFTCKLISYAAYFSLQCAAWLKTLATFARCVTLHHQWPLKNWISKPVIIKRIIWLVILLVAFLNFPIWIVNGELVQSASTSNGTHMQVSCYRSRFFHFWEITHLLLYNFIPFTLMILCNILIIRQVKQSQRKTKLSKCNSQSSTKSSQNRRPKSSDGGRLTKTLILITILFIVFTSPAAIFYIFVGKIEKVYRDLITMSLSNLATTSHITSFIVYWLTSSDFKDAAISLLCCRPMVPHKLTIEKKRDKFASVPLPSAVQSNDENQGQLPLFQSSTTLV